MVKSETLPPIILEHTVEGIQFATPVLVDIGPLSNQGAQYTARSNIDELVPFLNTLADRQAGGDIRHTGTQVWVENGMLKVKVHLEYHVGGLIGSTNGSVVALIRANVADDAVSISVTAIDLNISNDFVRIGSDLSGFRDKIKAQVLAGLEKVLSADNATLSLPKPVKELGVTLETAHFESRDNSLFAVLSGKLPPEIRVIR